MARTGSVTHGWQGDYANIRSEGCAPPFLSWGKCQKEWFEYSLTWNVWRKCLWENFQWLSVSIVWPGLQTGYYLTCEAISPLIIWQMGGKNRKEKRKKEEATSLWDNMSDTGNPCQPSQAVTQPRSSSKPHWVLMDGALGFWWSKETLGGPPVSPPVSLLILHSGAEPCRSKTVSKSAE